MSGESLREMIKSTGGHFMATPPTGYCKLKCLTCKNYNPSYPDPARYHWYLPIVEAGPLWRAHVASWQHQNPEAAYSQQQEPWQPAELGSAD